MADITMCMGDGCSNKGKCHRFLAKPNPWRQSYFTNPPIVDGQCEYFWETKKDSESFLIDYFKED